MKLVKENMDKIKELTREQLIALCVVNDDNGIWTDEDCKNNGYSPMTKVQLISIIEDWIREIEEN